METVNSSKPQPESKEPAREVHHHYQERAGGSFGRVFLGLLIVFFGLAFLAQNAGFIGSVDWGFLLSKIWPVFIILVGLSLLRRGGFLGGLIAVLAIALTLGILGFFLFAGLWVERELETENFSIPRESGVQNSFVAIKAGAVKLRLSGGADVLVSGKLESNFMRLMSRSLVAGTTQEVTLRTDGNFRGFVNRPVNLLEGFLDATIPTTLEIDAGASDINLDLSEVMVKELDLNTGASSLNLTLGDKTPLSRVSLKAGASSISISLPRALGAKLLVKAGLSSKNFIDFKQLDERTYESLNYASSARKVEIAIDAGVSNLNVNWK